MRIGKFVAVLLLVGLISLLFCACAESFTYTEYTDGDGAIHFEYLLTYDPAAADADLMKRETAAAMERFVTSKALAEYATVDSLSEGEVALRIVFPTATDYYIWKGYTGREENLTLEPVKKGLINAYDQSRENYLTERNISLVRSLVDDEYGDFELTGDFYYTYGTVNKRTRSNGETEYKDGVYYHTWKIEPGSVPDIRIRVYGLNGAFVYSLTISVFVLSLVIIFVIINTTSRRRKARASRGPIAEAGADGSPVTETKE